MQIVFPRWVTKLGALAFAIGLILGQFQDQVLNLLGPLGIAVPSVITTALVVVGGVLGILGRALMDADGDGVPDGFSSRRGHTRVGVMALLTLLGACGLIGAGRSSPPVGVPDVAVAIAVVADSASARMGCKVPAPEMSCRWSFAVAGAALPAVPDGLEAAFKFAAPAPGDSVRVTGEARLVRRGLVANTAKTFSAWAVRTDTPPVGVPDSVFVIEITMPPVGP